MHATRNLALASDGTIFVEMGSHDNVSEYQPGAKIFIAGAARQPDGSLVAARIGVGRDGLTPPM